MLDKIENVKPKDIEKRSFEIISEIIGEKEFPKFHDKIIKRVIHTTADFEFLDLVNISDSAVERAFDAISKGSNIITDTKMVAAGISKKAISKYGGKVISYMDNEEVAKEASSKNVTRSSICMEWASKDPNNKIFAIGNAPTALIRLYELVKEGKIKPELIIGVPVGFVNVIESKEIIKELGVPFIITEGRKGGSTIAAAISNAILYMMD